MNEIRHGRHGKARPDPESSGPECSGIAGRMRQVEAPVLMTPAELKAYCAFLVRLAGTSGGPLPQYFRAQAQRLINTGGM